MKSFKSEEEMSFYFSLYLRDHPCYQEYKRECEGLFGIPDFLVKTDLSNGHRSIIAFELKLRNWRKALCQAFKYKSFSNQAIVLLDENQLPKNILHIVDQFKKANIGLWVISKSLNINIIVPAVMDKPYSEKLTEKTNYFFDDNYDKFLNYNHNKPLPLRRTTDKNSAKLRSPRGSQFDISICTLLRKDN